MNWIPVTERMPPVMDKVYYFVKYGENETKGTLFGQWFSKWNVTHWLDESATDPKELISLLEEIWMWYQQLAYIGADAQMMFERIPKIIEGLRG